MSLLNPSPGSYYSRLNPTLALLPLTIPRLPCSPFTSPPPQEPLPPPHRHHWTEPAAETPRPTETQRGPSSTKRRPPRRPTRPESDTRRRPEEKREGGRDVRGRTRYPAAREDEDEDRKDRGTRWYREAGRNSREPSDVNGWLGCREGRHRFLISQEMKVVFHSPSPPKRQGPGWRPLGLGVSGPLPRMEL